MSMQLDIVTPEKKAFSDEVENVYLPGADGEMGVLPSHAGLVTALQAGELRYLYKGEVGTLAVGSGFAEITQEKVVVLTDMALGEDEIDEEETEKAIERAKEQLHEQEHDLDAEEVAHIQGMISKQMAALNFKRKYKR